MCIVFVRTAAAKNTHRGSFEMCPPLCLQRETGSTQSEECLRLCYFTYGDEFKTHARANSLGSRSSATSEAEYVRSVSRAKDQLFATAGHACS